MPANSSWFWCCYVVVINIIFGKDTATKATVYLKTSDVSVVTCERKCSVFL